MSQTARRASVVAVSFLGILILALAPMYRGMAQDPAQPPAAVAGDPAASLGGKVLFDFESEDDVKAWSPLAIEGSKLPGAKEPAAKLDLSAEGATSGKRALKVTFDGGTWPTITTAAVPVAENWVALKFQTFKADVTVSRPCLVGFRVLMENRKRDNGYTWAVTKICRPGKNELAQALGGWWTGMEAPSSDGKKPGDGKITGLDFFMYDPHPGESVFVDNVRITTDRLPADKRPVSFKVKRLPVKQGEIPLRKKSYTPLRLFWYACTDAYALFCAQAFLNHFGFLFIY